MASDHPQPNGRQSIEVAAAPFSVTSKKPFVPPQLEKAGHFLEVTTQFASPLTT